MSSLWSPWMVERDLDTGAITERWRFDHLLPVLVVADVLNRERAGPVAEEERRSPGPV